jgi:hypothetical protein
MGDEPCYLYKDRGDRMGSNFMVQIGIYILSKKEGVRTFMKKAASKYRYINTLFFRPFRNDLDMMTAPNPQLKHLYGGMRGPVAQFVIENKQDAASYFYENFRDDYFKQVAADAEKMNYVLPWKNKDDAICFHLRFEDMARERDINGTSGFNRYVDWIHKGTYENVYKKDMADDQCPININLFEKKVISLQSSHPDKQIYIITHGSVPAKYMGIVDKYGLVVFNKNSEEYDCWLMANCHTLVITKSTFPIIPAFYFQGKEIHYQVWPRWACMGIGTKYDRSGWIGFE